ncbi:MAG: tetratricopeptide repeat protein [Limisphaerales bacterium]
MAACLLAGALGWGGLPVRGAPAMSAEETNAFATAFNLFSGQHFSFAENSFSNFLAQFTNSPHRADAILYLARARLEQSNYNGAIDLLEANFASANNQARDYVFWIAKARLNAGDNERAAVGFSNYARSFPDAPARLEAAYGEADARARMDQWAEVIHLLQPTNGVFRLAAAGNAKSDFATMGALLLGEAFFAETNYSAAEKVVRGVETNGLKADFRWQRQFLTCQIELAEGEAQAALKDSTNLLDVSFGSRHQAESVFLQGQILEKLGRRAEALQNYLQDLDNLPDSIQGQAVAKTVQLTISLNTNAPAAAIPPLNLLARRPQTNGLEVARLSLGELYLQACLHPPKPAESSNAPPELTNGLELALTNFTVVIRDFPLSPLCPKAHLDRGWCYWAAGKNREAKSDFADAAVHLPFSEDRAMALFKLADAEIADRDYDGAATNYNLLLAQYQKFPAITNGLFDLALYQLAEADIHRGDDEGARAAVKKILEWFPGSYFGGRGLLLVGEDLDSQKSDYAAARKVFHDVAERSPDSTLAAEAQYAIARTYDHERNWPVAIGQYSQWITNYSRHPLLPEVEFSLGWAYDQAGMESNALTVFSNYVVRFPTNAQAAWAQNWVGDYHFDRQDYPAAEKDYQAVFQKFGEAGELPWRARLMAGKSALAHLAVEDARKYFLDIVNSTNAPAAVGDQGTFALGDVYFQLFQANTNNQTNLYNAITALSRLTNGAPTNAIAIQALGRLGDYYQYWGDINSDTNKSVPSYAEAAKLYEAVANLPASSTSPADRCQAEVGLGVIAEKQHLPEKALEHYFKVLYEADPARVDPYWVDRAGEFAARLCEAEQKWDRAIRIYRRVIETAPALGPILEKKIAAAQSHPEPPRN